MRAIFGKAHRVLAWFGEDCPEGSAMRSFDFLEYLSSRWKDPNTRSLAQLILEYNTRPSIGEDCAHRLLTVGLFLRAFNKSWFTRRWVVQEIAVSMKNATVMCGESVISWLTMRSVALPILRSLKYTSRAVSILAMHESELKGAEELCSAVLARNAMHLDRTFVWRYFHAESIHSAEVRRTYVKSSVGRIEWAPVKAQTAIENLDQFHAHECSDGRDRIGTLNGLQGGMLFHIDYNATTEDNFVAFAAKMVANGQVYRLMRSAVHRQQSHLGPRILPSWVPDWRISLPSESELGKEIHLSEGGRYTGIYVDGAQLSVPLRMVRGILDTELSFVFDTQSIGWLRALTTREDLICLAFFQFSFVSERPPFSQSPAEEETGAEGVFVLQRQRTADATFELLQELPPQHNRREVTKDWSRAYLPNGHRYHKEVAPELPTYLQNTNREYIYID